MGRVFNLKNTSRLFLLLVFFFALYNVIPQIYKSNIKIKKLRIELQQLANKKRYYNEKMEDYDKMVDNLETDFEKEKIARNRLQMVKKNEEIYRLVEKVGEDK